MGMVQSFWPYSPAWSMAAAGSPWALGFIWYLQQGDTGGGPSSNVVVLLVRSLAPHQLRIVRYAQNTPIAGVPRKYLAAKLGPWSNSGYPAVPGTPWTSPGPALLSGCQIAGLPLQFAPTGQWPQGSLGEKAPFD